MPDTNNLAVSMAVVVATCLAAAGCMRETVTRRPAAEPTSPSSPSSSTVSTAERPAVGLLDVPDGQPEEFGAVRFGRDFEAALAESKKSGKPVFLLFTEVPGCSTVKGFGNGPLRHPLIVEAIETEFVPVVVRNNVGGEEREILKAFGEPTWNNPVVRFIDHERNDLVPRYARGWTADGLASSMVAALEEAKRDVPGYLSVLNTELGARTSTTLFSMYCFWSGEVGLAGLPGVVSTRPGFANGREVVEVTWDTTKTSLDELVEGARRSKAASGVVADGGKEARVAGRHFDNVVNLRGSFRFSAKDDKYQIRKRAYGWVPMTPAQATRVNRAVVKAGEPLSLVLSPRQLAFARSDERFDGAPAPGLVVVND